MCNKINGGNKNNKKERNKNEIVKFLNSYAENVKKNNIKFGQHEDQEGDEQWFKNQKWDVKYKLHYACMVGDIKQINILLNNKNINKNEKMNEWDDMTPIMVAALYDQLLSLIELLKYNIDALPPPNRGNATPFSVAINCNNKSIINFYKEYIKFMYGMEINNSLHLQCLYLSI